MGQPLYEKLSNSNFLKTILFIGLLVNFVFTANPQNIRDTLRLPLFEVKSVGVTDVPGFKKTTLDSITLVHHLDADLSKIISENTTIFIKSYGNGTLATPSFRGTTAQHTQVEWNGINLNSPMLGQMDFSQIPVSQFDEIEILYGAAGIAKTSGAFGGVINLTTSPDWNQRIKIALAQTLGNFETYYTNFNLIAGSQSFQSHTKASYSSSLNNFPYYNDYLGGKVRQQNSGYSLSGFSEELFWKIKDKHLLSGRVWYSYDDRNLPPTASQYDQEHIEKQKDKTIRSILEYKFVESNFNAVVTTSLIDQYMNYQLDSTLNSTHQYYSWINRARFSFSGIRNFTIKPGLDFIRDRVSSDSYDGIKTRTTAAIYAETRYNFKDILIATLVLREELIDNDFLPLIPAFGLEYLPIRGIDWKISANLARNHRYPTLNDQFWILSGNPDLKTEVNYSTEIGTGFRRLSPNQKFLLDARLSGYYSWIFDMITWLPVEGSNLWKPENIDEVHARGLEVELALKGEVAGFLLSLMGNYSYCRSTYAKANLENDNKIGKQLIYIPVHNFNSTFSVKRWNFFLNYNVCYISDRYTGKDNFSYMPAYSLSNILFGKNIVLTKYFISLQLEINNIFNLDYQSVANRPMPGLNGALTLRFSFASPSKR